MTHESAVKRQAGGNMIRTGKEIAERYRYKAIIKERFAEDIDTEFRKIRDICRPIKEDITLLYFHTPEHQAFIDMVNELEELK